MQIEKKNLNQPLNQQRRKLLKHSALLSAAVFTPVVFGKTVSHTPPPMLSGKLVCNIANPIKTLILQNQSDREVVVEHISQGALMFDGSVIDCNTACLTKPITIPARQEIHVKFDRRQQKSAHHKIDEYRRIQSRVTRLGDGTRVIPFNVTLSNKIATLV